jgi:hypothetical protein
MASAAWGPDVCGDSSGLDPAAPWPVLARSSWRRAVTVAAR